jgi:hypothetical protein
MKKRLDARLFRAVDPPVRIHAVMERRAISRAGTSPTTRPVNTDKPTACSSTRRSTDSSGTRSRSTGANASSASRLQRARPMPSAPVENDRGASDQCGTDVSSLISKRPTSKRPDCRIVSMFGNDQSGVWIRRFTQVDMLAAGLRMAPGSLGSFGAILAEFTTQFVPMQRLDRIQDFVEQLNERLSGLEVQFRERIESSV